jgi:protein-disulfide isomerase
LRTQLTLALLLVPGLLSAQEASYRVRGAPDAPVELAIYSDFECPYCRNFALAALPAIVSEFVDRGLVRIRYVYFPLLYVRQPEWSGAAAPNSLWVGYAENLGLDGEAFAACLVAAETNAAVEEDLREALGYGATGTPTIVLDGQSLTELGSYEELRAAIVAAIEAAGG